MAHSQRTVSSRQSSATGAMSRTIRGGQWLRTPGSGTGVRRTTATSAISSMASRGRSLAFILWSLRRPTTRMRRPVCPDEGPRGTIAAGASRAPELAFSGEVMTGNRAFYRET